MPTSNEEKNKVPAHKAKNKKSLTSIVTVILSLIALSFSVYAVYANMRYGSLANQQARALETDMNNLKQLQTANATQLTGAIKTMDLGREDLNNKVSELNQSLQTALKQQLYQNKDWLLLKARYYLELAEINNHWSSDSAPTMSLMKQADALLAETHENRLLSIRQTLAKEILLIQTAPTLDLAGLLSQLDAIQSMIDKTPTNLLVLSDNSNPNELTNKDASTWHQHAQQSINFLKKLVIIRHHDQDIQPQLTEAQETIMREELRLNLAEIQWAILHNNEAIYQMKLQHAILNLKRLFAKNIAAVDPLLQKMNALQKIELIQQKPDIGAALKELNELIASTNLAGMMPAKAGETSE